MAKKTIQEEQEDYITDFNALGDWMTQYQCLLELTADMEKMEASEKNARTLIPGCQAKLWVAAEYQDGRICVRADSESLIVKGIVAVIVALFDGRTPGEIAEAKIDFMERTPIRQQISTDRFHGMQSVVAKITDYAQQILDLQGGSTG